MFSLEGKNKLGLFNSFIYVVLIFIRGCASFIAQFALHSNYNLYYRVYQTFYIVDIAAMIVALFIVLSFAKNFFTDRSLVTLIIGACIFVGDSIFVQVLALIFDGIFSINILIVPCFCIAQLLMSIRLIRSPNIGKLVGLIGLINIVVQILLYLNLNLYISNALYLFVSWASSTVSAGVIFSYFLCYERV